MNYFEAIRVRADELNERGQQYLDSLPFLSNQEVIPRLIDAAQKMRDKQGLDRCPDWVEWLLYDGVVPFSPRRNGSLYYALGYAMVAADALLRHLLETVEGRTKTKLKLACLAEQDVVDRYCQER
jgi:hypothetical protein